MFPAEDEVHPIVEEEFDLYQSVITLAAWIIVGPPYFVWKLIEWFERNVTFIGWLWTTLWTVVLDIYYWI